ncbi:hypothetical protein SAMN04488505_102151 [Chitinophaga rupis]|uniref:Uncharacterized protein n=1 Tax=Chitinophaga rupis TaxID=573321 RepID=A0A1H7PSG5_9BACT|nr:hypothetical protein SAMN04488505_102151 [Chitinophaga rupis]
MLLTVQRWNSFQDFIRGKNDLLGGEFGQSMFTPCDGTIEHAGYPPSVLSSALKFLLMA